MRRFTRFNVVSAAGMAVQLGLVWLLTAGLAANYAAATAIAVGAAVVHNFIWHWCWTWSDRIVPPANLAATFARFVAANGLVSLSGNLVLMGVLTGAMHVPPVAANLAAIGACGLVNFALGDRVVFRVYSVRPIA